MAYPVGWTSAPIRQLARLRSGAGFPDEFQGIENEELPFLKVRNLGANGNALAWDHSVSRETARQLRAAVLRPPAIVMAKIGAALLLARFRRVDFECCIDNNMLALEFGPRMDVRFAQYALTLVDTALLVNPGAVPSLNMDSFRAVRLPLPSRNVQGGIADHLDRETTRIDDLIAEQEALITSLAERRQALVMQVVTKGLNPSTAMGDSGVRWIGDMPTGWRVGNIRHFAAMKSGHTPSRAKEEYWTDCTIPWFTLADVWQLRDGRQKYLGETSSRLSQLGLANSAAELLPAGTVVLSRTASVGFSGIMPTPMATSQDFWNWVCNGDLLPDYLLWVFRAMHHEFKLMMRGSTHQTIYQPIAASICVPVPTLAEQCVIAEHLDRATTAIDRLTAECRELITLLRERRSALITAAVTGKIDVSASA